MNWALLLQFLFVKWNEPFLEGRVIAFYGCFTTLTVWQTMGYTVTVF